MLHNLCCTHLYDPSYSSNLFNQTLLTVNQEYNVPHFSSDDVRMDSSYEDNYYDWSKDDPSVMIYTSGTTGRPKGAVHSAGSLTAMVKRLHTEWHYSQD